MINIMIGAAAATFAISLIFRVVFSTIYAGSLPFSLGIVDALIVCTGAAALVLSTYKFIINRFPDTREMLPLFSSIFFTTIIVTYLVLRYLEAYQTSLSILVTGVFVGMGWWIQAITTAANARRTHTLNIIMASRTSSEYQSQTRNSSALYRASVIPPELAEWRFNPNKEEFKNAKIPTEIADSIQGTVYVLNYFEFLAQGIKFKDLDDCLLRECFCGILAGIEHRSFHLIIEAQKSDQRSFEGVIRLSKEWNGESVVERYRSNPNNAAIGPLYPTGDELEAILNCPPNKAPENTAQP